MMRIGIISVWIGKLTDSFPLWLRSVEINKDIDFWLITDQDVESSSSNVHIRKETLSSIKGIFETELNMNIRLEMPYKLSEYKPIWRVLIKPEIEQYDFWGHMDLDVILGDLRRFLTDELISQYDKILDQGNLTLYRNNELVNNLYKKSDQKDNMAYSYKAAYKNDYACYFDEYMGMNILGWKYLRVFRDHLEENFIQDFSWNKLPFTSYISKESFVLYWNNGKLYRVFVDDLGNIKYDNSGKRKEDEIALVHIQKRSMFVSDEVKQAISDGGSGLYWIIPNEYTCNVPNGELYSDKDKVVYEKETKLKDRKRSLANMKRNGLLQYLPHYFRRKKIVKWIRSEKGFF